MKWFLVILVCLLVSCRTIKNVPVETTIIENNSMVRNDSVRTDKETMQKDSSVVTEKVEKNDSVVIKDSSVIVVNDKGEVLKQERFNSKEVYSTKELRRMEEKYNELKTDYRELQSKYDALLRDKEKTKEVPVIVEKPLSKWQNFLLKLGGIAFSAIVAFVLIVVGKIVYKLRKK